MVQRATIPSDQCQEAQLQCDSNVAVPDNTHKTVPDKTSHCVRLSTPAVPFLFETIQHCCPYYVFCIQSRSV